MKRSIQHFLQIIGLVLVTACGGGGSDSQTPEPMPDPTPAPEEESRPTETNGVVTGFGSVFVNGVRYETDSATVTSDESDSATESDLQVGMVVSVTGEVSEDGQSGVASSIHFEAQLKGPVEGVDIANSQIFILGKLVLFDDLTNFENFDPAMLVPGAFIEVSGFYDVNGDIYATRIELEDNLTEIKFEGTVASLDTAAETFLMGNITIDYSTAVFDKMTVEELENGMFVRVKGSPENLNANVFTVSEVKKKNQFEDVTNDTQLHIEGFISAFEAATNFTVNGVAVTTNDSTVFLFGSADDLALNVRVKIKGSFDIEGTLVANEVIFNPQTTLKVEAEVEGVDVSANTVTLIGAQFTLNSLTRLKDDSEQDIRDFDLGDLIIGNFVKVKGFVDADGVNIVTKLEREDTDDSQLTELQGLVTEVLASGFVIANVTVTVDSSTKFENSQDVELSQETFFALVSAGVSLKAEGTVVSGELLASKVQIEIEDDNGEAEVEFRGVLEEISEVNITVSGRNVLISENTEYEVMGESFSSQSFWQLASEGDQVKVKGSDDGQGNIQADSLDLELEQSVDAGEISMFGTPFFADEVLQVLEHVVSFDELTDIEGEEGEISAQQFVQEIANWPGVEVDGVIRNDIIYASKIAYFDDEEELGIIEITGAFMQQDDVTLKIAGHDAILNSSSKFEINDVEVTKEAFFSQIAANSRIKVEGHVELTENGESGTVVETIVVSKVENENDET